MKKWFITFCALGLISTQVPTADAASNIEEGQDQSINRIVKVVNANQSEDVFANFIKDCSLNSDDSFKDIASKLKLSKNDLEKLVASKIQEVANQQAAKSNNNQTANQVKEKEVVVNQPKAPTKQQKPAETSKSKPSTTVTNKNTSTPPTNNQAAKETTKQPTAPTSKSNSVSAFEEKVVELTNAERAKNGLAPLKMHAPLMAVAKAKSEDMAKNNYFSHTSPTYGSPFDQMKAAGISYRAAGENIAQGQRTPEEVVQAWMNSSGHRANILNANFTHIGVGYVASGNYWTQQFIQL